MQTSLSTTFRTVNNDTTVNASKKSAPSAQQMNTVEKVARAVSSTFKFS